MPAVMILIPAMLGLALAASYAVSMRLIRAIKI